MEEPNFSLAIGMITDILDVYRDLEDDEKKNQALRILAEINNLMYVFFGQQDEKRARQSVKNFLEKRNASINFWVADLK